MTIPPFKELASKWETTWHKPPCQECLHFYMSDKGGRCYAIYPYIGIRQDNENNHHFNCPVTNYYEGRKIGERVSKWGQYRQIAKITVLRQYIKRKKDDA